MMTFSYESHFSSDRKIDVANCWKYHGTKCFESRMYEEDIAIVEYCNIGFPK